MRYKQSLLLDVLTVALSVFFLIHAILFWRDVYFIEDQKMVDDPLVVQTNKKEAISEDSIIVWDPFQVKPPDKPKFATKKPKIAKKVIPKVKKSNALVKTKLQLQLLGTILDEKNSVAFITKNKRETDVYQVGDVILPGVKLVEIQLHKVIVDNKGRSEIIQEAGYNSALESLLSSGKSFEPSPNDVSSNKNSAAQKFEITPAGNNVYVSQKEVRKQVKNLSGLLSQVRVQPVFARNNRSKGFKLLHVNKGSFIEALGLRAGDTIRAINGTVVDSMQKGYELFNKLQSETSVDVEIIRNNQNKKIHFEMRN